MRVLVLGANGMLGNAMMRVLSERRDWKVFGTIRSSGTRAFFTQEISARLIPECDVEKSNTLVKVFEIVKPDVVINCIALNKQLADTNEPSIVIPIYSVLPHRLAVLCKIIGARLIHISTDGVFSGAKGGYTEDDPADAKDLYGISKFFGEVCYPHTITLRTSIIGHELQSSHGLLSWFLSQHDQCKCFSRVIFSGLPTVALAQVIRDIVIPKPNLFGLYHIAGRPISKYELLRLVADVYGKSIKMIPDDKLVKDLSLNANRFKAATGYTPPDWPELIKLMHSYH